MRFVAVKSEEAQAAAIVFRTRDLMVRQRTQAINALPGYLAEFGAIVAKGPMHVAKLVAVVEDPASGLPETARVVLAMLIDGLRILDMRVTQLHREIVRRAREAAVARRLMTIRGVGSVTATALAALAKLVGRTATAAGLVVDKVTSHLEQGPSGSVRMRRNTAAARTSGRTMALT